MVAVCKRWRHPIRSHQNQNFATFHTRIFKFQENCDAKSLLCNKNYVTRMFEKLRSRNLQTLQKFQPRTTDPMSSCLQQQLVKPSAQDRLLVLEQQVLANTTSTYVQRVSWDNPVAQMIPCRTICNTWAGGNAGWDYNRRHLPIKTDSYFNLARKLFP